MCRVETNICAEREVFDNIGFRASMTILGIT